jgi:hypothetical protein
VEYARRAENTFVGEEIALDAPQSGVQLDQELSTETRLFGFVPLDGTGGFSLRFGP